MARPFQAGLIGPDNFPTASTPTSHTSARPALQHTPDWVSMGGGFHGSDEMKAIPLLLLLAMLLLLAGCVPVPYS